ncbi:predicted protein, partial [Nematostella vectensis]
MAIYYLVLYGAGYMCHKVASIGVEVLKEKLNSLTIPDIHGDAGTPVGHISYDLTRPHISDSGSVDVSASGISFSVSVALGADSKGRPTVSAAGCSCSIGSGEFESAVHPVEAPFSPAPLPADTADKYMVYVWLTDYVINTAGLVYMKSGFMNRTVTQADLPKDFKFPLNTNTFKVIVYQLYNKYPDRPVRLKVYPTQSPAISSDVGGVNVSLVGHVEFYVDLQNGSSVFAFSLGLRRVDPSLVKSAIGNIEPNINLMKMFLNSFVDKLIINELNKYGDQGFPLPMIDGGKLVSPQISSGK